jgi:hypothetical protein
LSYGAACRDSYVHISFVSSGRTQFSSQSNPFPRHPPAPAFASHESLKTIVHVTAFLIRCRTIRSKKLPLSTPEAWTVEEIRTFAEEYEKNRSHDRSERHFVLREESASFS